jgi:ribosomal protein S18 acetylase RimI-like enzyme
MDVLVKKSTDISSALDIGRNNTHYFNSAGLEMMKKDLKIATLIGAYSKNKMVGFVAFKELNDRAVELAWMAIEPKYQDQNIGTLLVREGIKLLPKKYVLCETKTLSETDPDPGYARTRNFYIKLGFIPLDTINPYPGWGKDNPCQIFVKIL